MNIINFHIEDLTNHTRLSAFCSNIVFFVWNDGQPLSCKI